MSMKYMDEAKGVYFDMQTHEGNELLIDAVGIAETLLFAIALINGMYTRKGLKRIEEEIRGFSTKPDRFLATYGKLIRTDRKAEVQHLVNELIVETEGLWKKRFQEHPEVPDTSDLAGFYEEFKSTYNKLLLACDEKNYENAYYAAFMIDRETESFLVSFTSPGTFPRMIQEVIRNDYEIMRVKCVEHEQQLMKLLHTHGIGINVYSDIEEFRRFFLEKTT
jgi:hypothetical protein